ncbi:MAG: HAD family hydrolase [Candidatus Saccharimonadales bacterium]
MLKLIIFDWDDVFTRGSSRGYYKCYHEALVKVGAELKREEEFSRLIEYWGASHDVILAQLLRERPELIKKASEIYEKLLFSHKFLGSLSLVPGSNKLLTRLSSDYKLAIISGAHPKLLKEKVMPLFKVPNVFSHIITAYDIKSPTRVKPHPYAVRAIMKAEKAKPKETIMIGDAKNDVLMAQNAKIEPVVVLTGHLSPKNAEELGVKYIINNVTKLPAVLDQIAATA